MVGGRQADALRDERSKQSVSGESVSMPAEDSAWPRGGPVFAAVAMPTRAPDWCARPWRPHHEQAHDDSPCSSGGHTGAAQERCSVPGSGEEGCLGVPRQKSAY